MDVLENINSDDSLYIFCDASTIKSREYCCAGAVATFKHDVVKETYRILKDVTVPRAEIEAIKDGVYLALFLTRKYPILKHIYLFSDSELSVFGIRDRIFSWYCEKVKDKPYYGIYLGNWEYFNIDKSALVKHQDIFLEVLYTLLKHKLNLKIYHQKGHVNLRNRENVNYAINLFAKNNMIDKNLITNDFITHITYGNDYVDMKSRNELEKFMKTTPNRDISQAVKFTAYSPEIHKYLLELYEDYYGGQYNGR